MQFVPACTVLVHERDRLGRQCASVGTCLEERHHFLGQFRGAGYGTGAVAVHLVSPQGGGRAHHEIAVEDADLGAGAGVEGDQPHEGASQPEE
ncbi:hypothetical protein [Micromonospora sp. B11E3]|uniref:hypothetical protein n=1 Tax=Micromonospora sp. B11E3 TaxID=3153562 RepID=UPI00325FCED3